MKLVIDIPEEDYIRLRDEGMFGNVTTFKRAVKEGIPLEQEPCTDAISREAVLDAISNEKYHYWALFEYVRQLPPVTPQYTDAEIQKMQELEQAEIQKAYELGKADAEKVGHWIARGLVDSNGNRIYECSECHHSDTQAATMIVPYCWYCGSKMQEVME